MEKINSISGSWNFGAEKESLIHRIHSYPAKFPGFITTKALEYAQKEGVKVYTVADVFCGCGTTAVEAKRKGKNFWGCDINPVATLIAEVKTKKYNDATLRKYFSAIEERFYSTRISNRKVADVNERIKYWFNKRNIEDLLRLEKIIMLEIPKGSPYKKFFRCAFSNILKPTSNWLTKSIKPQIDPSKPPSDVMKVFTKQIDFMRKANKENIFSGSKKTNVEIMQRNFLAICKDKYKADLIVTSPPYVTSYDYADIHQLSILWLERYSDYRDLRKNMIGNIYQIKGSPEKDLDDFPDIGRRIYESLFRKHKAKAASTAKYFVDIGKSVEKCYEVLNKNGMAVFVIGDTSYRGIRINNSMFLKKCMKDVGFQRIKRIHRKISLKTLTPYRDSKGRFTRSAGHREVYKSEFVVIGRKV